ncbi:hypothetical protein COX93_03270 [Candidatus Nomurabacteria bacterium CG_4_10_14_0_2_um_filter_30_12]|uniref:Uncharacterized protein n=3 Tax=Candidatus Nomuraibacteriota TaxID=1752729 RepID=A0A1J4V4R8_9BACT|nr:MAG: hypothetical protein AUJ22_01145 [Candidatus Nomurabacteria bacterium CG1_02_31_12]PIR68715.1 MAG: hypothetical protein COU48_02520 [Candidatus Nomurabacteria bacterium CG10_big_fil_rev_8_21_14_0_10_03_31_7]PIZ86776.1 MAG: hypothetical protein COX93_03270 [Candidatus Nomurabacteria bacterium CG_4_10_14_0_2_um_filter_30_12]
MVKKLKIKMSSKIKNIIIFTVIGVSLILVYIFFIKKAPDQGNLISSFSTSGIVPENTGIQDGDSTVSQDFLSVLLGVKNIKLDDSIFSNKSFINLHDSSILLTSPGDEGRVNPFAPIGNDPVLKQVDQTIFTDSTPIQ